MGFINVLNKQMAELIAAGEVVERPASVVKELVENSIDAGATQITVEIERGGILLIRISDNGCGISREDVPTAFLRHATSKISTGEDLDAIGTLGFRGEALAAISAVSKCEIITRRDEDEFGTLYSVCGGEAGEVDDIGCAQGTTITVRDLFYNTPARMKFLKKDVSEGNAVCSVVDRIAMSKPHISFKLIRDGKVVRSTPGDNKLSSAIYTVLGRDFSASVQPVDYELRGVKVVGYISKPASCRANRNLQYTYINGRLVRSKTIMAALEQAYKNSSMVGKFPACVLHIELPLSEVDVNVHPAKTEVRFSDEKRIFDAVYYAVKNTIVSEPKRPVMQFEEKQPPAKQAVIGSFFENISSKSFVERNDEAKPASKVSEPEKTVTYTPAVTYEAAPENDGTAAFSSLNKSLYSANGKNISLDIVFDEALDTPPTPIADKNTVAAEEFTAKAEAVEEKTPTADDVPVAEALTAENVKLPVRFIGEAFSTYIIAQQGDELILLDKHAAHERIIFDELKKSEKPHRQMLLTPVSVSLSADEYDAVLDNLELINSSGYSVEDFGGTILLRAVPSYLSDEDPADLLREIAGGFCEHKKTADTAKMEWLYHSVACRAAVKAGTKLSAAELAALAERVLEGEDIMYCPHGRPVAIRLTKKDIEKQFGRLG